MDSSLTVFEKIRAFVTRLSPDPVCDDCITQKLALKPRQRASHKINELAGSDGFERSKAACSFCEIEKTVIRLK